MEFSIEAPQQKIKIGNVIRKVLPVVQRVLPVVATFVPALAPVATVAGALRF